MQTLANKDKTIIQRSLLDGRYTVQQQNFASIIPGLRKRIWDSEIAVQTHFTTFDSSLNDFWHNFKALSITLGEWRARVTFDFILGLIESGRGGYVALQETVTSHQERGEKFSLKLLQLKMCQSSPNGSYYGTLCMWRTIRAGAMLFGSKLQEADDFLENGKRTWNLIDAQ